MVHAKGPWLTAVSVLGSRLLRAGLLDGDGEGFGLCDSQLGLDGYDRFSARSDVEYAAVDRFVVSRWIDNPQLILLKLGIIDRQNQQIS